MTMWQPTKEQERILTDNSKDKHMLISAAAGSGKTRVLTEKIIRIIENEDIKLSDILVMTFTVKATQEMKSRIKSSIDEKLKENPKNEKLIMASATIQNANITTIDSFCKNIVDKYYTVLNKSDSLYRNFDPGYRIADEKELSILYDDVLDKMLEEIVYSNKEIYGDFLNAYLKKNIDGDIKEKLFNKAFMFLNTIPDAIEKIDKWKNNRNKMSSMIEDETDKMLETTNNDTVNFEGLFYDLIKEYYKRIINEKVSRNVYAISDYALLSYEILKCGGDELINEFRSTYKYIFVDEYQDTSIIQEEILSKIANDHNLFMVGDVKQSIYRFRNAEPKLFLNKTNDYYEKKENSKYNLISMNKNFRSSEKIIEFTNTVFGKIMTNDFAGIDYKNDGMMIYKNWDVDNEGKIVKLENSAESSEDNKNVEVHVVCEKDFYNETKKITDFNNELKSIEDKKAKLESKINKNIKKIDTIDKNIQKENEKVPKTEKGKLGQEKRLKDFEEEKNNINVEIKNDKIELEKITNEYENKLKESPNSNISNSDSNSLEEKKQITANEVEAEFIASKIERLVKEEGAQYKDIVVLFRSFYSRADIYLDAFKKHNIPVYAQMKKGFFGRMEIRLMIDILNVIDNEQQDIPVANVLSSNIFGLSNNEMTFIKLAALNQDMGNSFISSVKFSNLCLKYIYSDNVEKEADKDIDDKLKDKIKLYVDLKKDYEDIIDFKELSKKLSSFIEKFNDLRNCARYFSISELIEKIYDELDVKNIMLSMNDGIMRTANLDELYELANRYENSSFVGLFNFLRYIEKIKELKDDQGLAQICDENDNVVRIMSIHQSKGLEFNYVFVSGCGSTYNSRDSWDSNLLQTDVNYGIALDDFNLKEKYCIQSLVKAKIAKDKLYDNMREEMRMLYVAITRAKKRLFITAAVNRGNNGLSFKKAYETYVDKYNHNVVDFEVLKDNDISPNEDLSNDKCDDNNKKTEEKLDVSKLKTYIDLILSSMTKDTKCCTIYNNIITVNKQEDNMTTKLTLKDVLKDVEDNDYDKVSSENPNEINELIANLDYNVLNNNISEKYEFECLKEIIKPKFSVSEIKKEHYDSKLINRNKRKPTINPEKVDEENDKERKDSTNIGNIYHSFMEFYNFENVDENNERYVKLSFDDEKDLKGTTINRKEELKEKFNTFLKSDFAKDIIKAYKNNKLYREYKFMQLVSQNDINKYLSKYGIEKLPNIDISDNDKNKTNYFDEKNIVIQGIIDAFYINDNDEIVVIDWKTDGIKNGRVSENELVDNYQVQLEIYGKVLSELTGLIVKKRYIYSFTLNKEIEIMKDKV